jgi:hypothetical protein
MSFPSRLEHIAPLLALAGLLVPASPGCAPDFSKFKRVHDAGTKMLDADATMSDAGVKRGKDGAVVAPPSKSSDAGTTRSADGSTVALDGSLAASDGGTDAATSEPSTAVVSVGNDCSHNAELGCASADSALSVVCVQGHWMPAGTCAPHEACDTRLGPTQGRCLPLIPECEDKHPGDEFCRGNDRSSCGPDRVTATMDPCPDGNVCVLDNGAASCTPDTDECALNSDDCDDDPDARINTLGTYECHCPQYYVGDGHGPQGCTDALECATNNGGCDTTPMATCNEVVGGPPACVCPAGYDGAGAGESGCIDRDECKDGPVAACGEGATGCTNTAGNYSCACDPIFFAVTTDSRSCRSRWGAPTLVETNDTGDAMYPNIGVDSTGHVVAIWTQSEGPRRTVWTSRYTPGTGWGSPKSIVGGTSGNALTSSLAVDGAGNATAIWYSERPDNHLDVYANRYTVGVDWTTPISLDLDILVGGGLQILARGSEHAIALWARNPIIWDAVYTVAMGWPAGWSTSAQNDVSGDDSFAGAMDGSGNAMVVTPLTKGAVTDIWATRYETGSGWQPAVLIESSNADSRSPSVAMDGSGNAIASWSQMNQIWANRYTASNHAWDAARALNNYDASANKYDPTVVAADATGNATVVYLEHQSGFRTISASRYSTSDGWGAATSIGRPGEGVTGDPVVAMSTSGDAMAVWIASDVGNHILVNRRPTNGTWGTPVSINASGSGAATPQVVLDANGNAVAIWLQPSNGYQSLWSARFE